MVIYLFAILFLYVIILIFGNFIKLSLAENLRIFKFKENNRDIYYSFHEEFDYNSKIIKRLQFNIPNNIFQIWLNNNYFVPVDIFKNINFLKQKNKTWQYFLITPKIIDIIFLNNNDKFSLKIKKLYDNINHIHYAVRCDIIRYYLIYKFGGVYFDIKSNCNISLDKIINNDKIKLFNWCEPNLNFNFKQIFFPRMQKLYDMEIIQWFLAYPKEHYILKILLNNILINFKNYSNNKNIKQEVFEFSGPILYSNIIYKYLNKSEYELNKCYFNKLIFNNLNTCHKYYYKNVKHYSLINEDIIKVK